MAPALIAGASFFAHPAFAQNVYTSTPSNDVGDTFLCSGSNPDTGTAADDENFGGAGALIVAGADSTNGEFLSLIMFDLSGAKAQFDSTYGVGN